jgi:hypothetical protein
MLKDELEAIIKSDNGWSGRATLMLAIGILGEYTILPYFEHGGIKLFRSIFKGSRPSVLAAWSKRCKAILKFVFAVLVLLGVVGEYGFSSRIAENANRLQLIADQDLSETQERTIAATNLADKLSVLLEQQRLTAARFERQATLAESALQKELDQVNIDVKRREPRPVLLLAAHVRTDSRLQPFEGQRVHIFDCEGPTDGHTR